jgi:hypothetical protein
MAHLIFHMTGDTTPADRVVFIGEDRNRDRVDRLSSEELVLVGLVIPGPRAAEDQFKRLRNIRLTAVVLPKEDERGVIRKRDVDRGSDGAVTLHAKPR